MCIKCLIMQLRCIFFALCRRGAARRCADGGEGQQRLRRCARRSGLRRENDRPAAPGMASIQTYLNSLFIIPPFLRGVPSLN